MDTQSRATTFNTIQEQLVTMHMRSTSYYSMRTQLLIYVQHNAANSLVSIKNLQSHLQT